MFAFQFEQKIGLIDSFVTDVGKLDCVEDISLSPGLEPAQGTRAAGATCRQLLVDIRTGCAVPFWAAVQSLLEQPPFDELRSSLIVVCEGAHGWQDYVLLHHYDKAQKTGLLPLP